MSDDQLATKTDVTSFGANIDERFDRIDQSLQTLKLMAAANLALTVALLIITLGH